MQKLHGSHIYMFTMMCTESICVGTRTCVLPKIPHYDDDVDEEECAMCERNIRGAEVRTSFIGNQYGVDNSTLAHLSMLFCERRALLSKPLAFFLFIRES